ncbi:MAG: lysophospholipid acyltransferase family protein [Pseudomonadota bacterium]
MTNPQENSAAPRAPSDPWGMLRMAGRLPLLALHALVSLPVTLAVVSQGYNKEGARRRWAEGWMAWWSGTMLRIFGFRIEVRGEPAAEPVFILANHMSWADIELIHSQLAAGFVAKAEIARWPLIGFMAKVGGTVFHQRGHSGSQAQVTGALADRLRSGRSVAIFPEGRTGPGRPVLPFHGRMLQAAVETDTPIQPVAITFLRDGRFTPEIAFGANESFGASLVRLLRQRTTVARIHFLDTRAPDLGRSELARWARSKVAQVVEHDDPL